MKLLIENFRKFVNEDEEATMDMDGKSWNQVEVDKKFVLSKAPKMLDFTLTAN